jgi:DNA-binding HxlR family transcriptional regulator
MPKKRKVEYACGLEAALDVIGGRWKVLILWDLDCPRRFGELKRIVSGISEKMLIQQLREMKADGVVRRKVFHEVPPHVEYSLTWFGLSLRKALGPLCKWGTTHMERIGTNKESREAASTNSRKTVVLA